VEYWFEVGHIRFLPRLSLFNAYSAIGSRTVSVTNTIINKPQIDNCVAIFIVFTDTGSAVYVQVLTYFCTLLALRRAFI
jgi:hypothetical protein